LRRLATLLVAVVAVGALAVTAAPPAAASSHCSARTVAPPGSQPASRKIILNVCKGDTLIGDHWYWENATLWIGSQSTRATGCTLSLWTTQFSAGNAWNGPATFHDRRRTLRANATHSYSGNGSGPSPRR
jgi:5-keto 4-deoxyuronate isomerase